MSIPRNILINASNGQPLALATTTAQGSIADFNQGDEEPTVISCFVSDNQGGLTALDLSDATLAYAMVGGEGKGTGTEGGPPLIVYQDVWNWDATSKSFSALVNYNTQEVSDFIGEADSRETILTIKAFFNDGSSKTLLRKPATIDSAIIETNIEDLLGQVEYFVQTTTPTGTIPVGSFWLNTNTATLSVYSGGTWNSVHP